MFVVSLVYPSPMINHASISHTWLQPSITAAVAFTEDGKVRIRTRATYVSSIAAYVPPGSLRDTGLIRLGLFT